MRPKDLGRKVGMFGISAMMVFSSVGANLLSVQASDQDVMVYANTTGTMGSVIGEAQKDANSKNNTVKNQVDLEMTNGTLRVTFLKENTFRLNFEPNAEFVENAKPYVSESYNKVFILEKHASDFDGVEPTVDESGNVVKLSTSKLTLTIDKDTSLMKLEDHSGKTLWEEAEPIKVADGKTIQTLKTKSDEYFYGGGTQNGYFSHKNTKLKIETGGGWEDGGRSNPVPFYMSTNGYAVMRHTFTPGEYDFSETASFMHKEERFDAFYFVNDSLPAEIDAFTELTGRPVFWPRWAEYIGHADCYNYNANTGEREVNTHGATVLDNYITNHNVPLGWMLVNDGYGCHYGKTGTVDGNIENLKTFVDNANSKGVQVGLWTQSDLYNESPEVLRNIDKEVNTAGVRGIKTDVAWVGPGYDMQINSVSTAYNGIAQSGDRPYVFSLNGWAGSQRYAGIWSGDQTGGRWEYIRFQIPTYIGSGLSGQPNVGSDIDSIYKGSETIATRDVQWKAFTPMLYNMGGWDGSSADQLDGKTPWEFGGESEAIQRFYLKTRAEMTPYNYSNAHEANTTGMPMLRAMILEFPNDPYTYGKETQYQYMWGKNLLVAPVYEGSGKDTDTGIRNNIYLPDENQTWIDYFSGKQYQGGQSLYNYEAPMWKLPLFVKSGAIIPFTEENNASGEITDDKDRIFNIYPDGDTDFELYEDDGESLNGGTAITKITSSAPEIDQDGRAVDGTATIEVSKRVETGGYAALDKATEFQINTHKEPTSVKLSFNGVEQTLEKVTKDEYEAAVKKGDDSKNIYYYDTAYNLNRYEGSELINNGEIITAPKLFVKTVKTDVSETAMTLVVEGFNNSDKAEASGTIAGVPAFDAVDESLITPTSITLTWAEVENATSYDIEANGFVLTNVKAPFLHKDLPNKTAYTYKIRSVNDAGASAWSAPITVTTKEDPFKFSPENITASWSGPSGSFGGELKDIVDRNLGTQFHSKEGGVDQPIVLDMQYAYPINEFVYVPRQDYEGDFRGNGTVKALTLEVSVDGHTWKKIIDNQAIDSTKQQPMYNNVYAAVLKFDAEYARYVRLTATSTVGTFFTAQEVIPVIAEGGKPRTAGTPLEHTNALSDSDLIPMKMYSGSIPGDTTWAQVVAADVNYNKISDAYDLVNITSTLNGGITPSAENNLDGIINVIANNNSPLKTGETVRIDVLANNFVDINALSAEFAFKNDEFDILDTNDSPVKATANTLGMLNYSRYNPHGASSAEPTLYMDFANVGNKERLNGDFVVASFTMKAKKDNVSANVEVKNAIVVNSHMEWKEANPQPVVDEQPEIVTGKVARSDFDLTFTTPGITNDDGSNLMQGGKAAVSALFDGDLGTTMEFLWARPEGEQVVRLPLTMNFVFKNTKKITDVKIYNRLAGNGVIHEMQVIGYLGDQAFDLGTKTDSDADYQDGIYAFTTESGKDMFDRIEVKALKADNMTMLTLRELEIIESNEVDTTEVSFVQPDDVTLHVGKTKTVAIKVGPENAFNKNLELKNTNPSIANAMLMKDSDGTPLILIQGLVKGETDITVSSQSNSNVSATLHINVTDDIDITDFNKFLSVAEARINDGDLYQEAGQTALQSVYDIAKALDLETATQDQVDEQVLALAKAINSLVLRETNPDELINGSELSAATDHYSESNTADLVLDGDRNTYWESPYGGGQAFLPKSVTLSLPTISKINQVDYVPFQARNGLVTEYKVYTSIDGVTFTLVKEGAFNRSREDDYSIQSILFKTTEAKFVKFEVTKALGRIVEEDNKYARIAELHVYGTADATELHLDQSDQTLKVNETVTVNATSSPSYATDQITFTSSDASIASVDEHGVITANAAGTAVITASGNQASASLTITVDPLRDITVTITTMEAFVNDPANANTYTDATWTTLVEALDAAKAMTSANSQADIDQAEQALKAAHQNLIELTNKEKLEKVINDAKAIDNGTVGEEVYAIGSYQSLQKAIADAEAIYNDATKTEDDFALANKAIKDGINALVELGDLREAIRTTTMNDGDFSAASITGFNTTLENAKAVLANADATKEDVANAINTLATINDGLVDVAQLRAAIASANEFAQTGKDTFIPSYKETLQLMIEEATLLLDNATSQQTVSDMNDSLSTLTASPKYKGDKTQLQTVLSEAEAYISEKDTYTEVSYAVFEMAYEKAASVLSDENAMQTDIDEALNQLNDAIAGLKKVSIDEPVDPDKPVDPDQPVDPDKPVNPDQPVDPDKPVDPDQPVDPDKPVNPDQPVNPDKPVDPIEPTEPSKPEGPSFVDQIANESGNVVINGKLPADVKVHAIALSQQEVNQILNNLVDKNILRKFNFEKIYDIKMFQNGITYAPDGSIKISITLDKHLIGKKLKVLYISDDGKVTEMPSSIEGNTITFSTTHNSYYAIVSEKENGSPLANTAKQPFSSGLTSVIFLGAALLLFTKKMEDVLGSE